MQCFETLIQRLNVSFSVFKWRPSQMLKNTLKNGILKAHRSLPSDQLSDKGTWGGPHVFKRIVGDDANDIGERVVCEIRTQMPVDYNWLGNLRELD